MQISVDRSKSFPSVDTTMDIENSSRGARWVCPNDRHLALRAKLRTGWSVKTMTWESRWNSYPGASSYSGNANHEQSFVLTEEERRSIIQVIQRAEALDLSEQERVGKLVERLENMKRNVCIVTSSRSNERRSCGRRCSGGSRCVCACALCGEKFRAVLGASPNLCKDCRKYICQKCGIEANTVGGSGYSTDGSISSHSTSASGSTQERTTVQRIVQKSASGQKQFLCRICAETREMWKKSGAWFFKGMPKYVLPEKKERGWSRAPHRTSAWTVSGPCKSLESEPQDSSSEDDITRLPPVSRGHSASSTSLHSNRETPSKTTITNMGSIKFHREDYTNGLSPLGQRDDDVSGITERLERSTLSIPARCGRLPNSDSTWTIRSKSNGRNQSSNVQDQQHQQQQLQQQQSKSFESENVYDGNKRNESVDVNDENEKDDNIRRENTARSSTKGSQVQSVRQNSTMAISPTIVLNDVRMQERRTPDERVPEIEWKMCTEPDVSVTNSTRTASLVSSSLPPALVPTSPFLSGMVIEKGEDYGSLEVSLQYDPAAQCLRCKVERARGLRPMDIHGLADPFCKLNILPIGKSVTTKRLRTKTVHKTCDPEFNEVLNFYGTTEKDMTSKALHVLVLQDDPSGQDFLGEARFPLYELLPCQTKRYNVPLREHYPVECEEETWGTSSSGRGRIQLTLSYCTRRRALLVTVHRATNLLPMDSNGFSDPFVKLCLMEDATDNHRQLRGLETTIGRITGKRFIGKKSIGSRNIQNTSVKWKTLNPEWNEEFAFGTRLTDLTKLTLYLSLWDKDFGKSNDYLGGLTLGCSSKGARLRHWVDAIKFPDHRHQAWHDLNETIICIE